MRHLTRFVLFAVLAQIMIAAGVYPIMAQIRWRKEGLELHREDGTRKFKLLMNLGSAVTACMGLYWFVESLMGINNVPPHPQNVCVRRVSPICPL